MIYTKEQEQSILEKYANKKSLRSIASEFNRSVTSVLNVLKRNSVNRRTSYEFSKKYTTNDNAFSTINEYSAYFAGLILADGCIVESSDLSKFIKLSLAEQDYTLVERFRDFLCPTKPVRMVDFTGKGRQNMADVVVFSKKAVEDLKKLGIDNNKSKFSSICDELKLSRHFWRGVIDGDGSLVMDVNGRICLSLVGTETLMVQFKEFISTLIPNYKNKIAKHKSIWDHRVNGKRAVKVIDYLYSDARIYMDRKRKKALNIIEQTKLKYEE